MTRQISWLWVVALLLLGVAGAQDSRIAEQERQRGIVELWESLVPLKSVASFMTVGAHPDDERSSLLALLSQGYGVRTITVTANRGEGGQNAIGTGTPIRNTSSWVSSPGKPRSSTCRRARAAAAKPSPRSCPPP